MNYTFEKMVNNKPVYFYLDLELEPIDTNSMNEEEGMENSNENVEE